MGLFPPPKKVTSENFGKQEYGELLLFIERNVKFVKGKCKGIREEMIPKWIRIYRGVPNERQKTWPWPGASNLVIQVAATHSDELLSRVMAMYQTDPLYNCKPSGDFDIDTDASGDDQAQEIEYLMQDLAYEPEELDLFRVEETGYSSAIRFGTGVFKFPWEYVAEQQATYIGGGTEEGTSVNYVWDKKYVRRDGPKPINVPLADWSIDPKWSNLNEADFKVHTLHLNGYQLARWKDKDCYDEEAVAKVLNNPDRMPEYRRQLEEQKEVETEPEEKVSDNYDIEEAWFTYHKGNDIYRLISWYHIGTDTHIGCIFNVYPKNLEPFEDAKLAYDDDMYHGYGFCEMLESYQREVSTTHNWRMDNRHFATTGIVRVNKNSKLSSILQIYPGALIPADEGELEAISFGGNAMSYDTGDEQLTLSLAAQRAGVDPAVGGAGGGTTNPKKGGFSAQGSAVVMQQSANNRNNLRMSDMRFCHVRMGRKILDMYAEFGLGDKLRKYGNRQELIKKALANYKSGKLGLSMIGSTASINAEMEKQNDVLLSATLERLYAGDLQIMQAFLQPTTPPELKQLMVQQLRAKNSLMKDLLRSFGKRGYERLLAVPSFMKEGRMQNGPQGGGGINPARTLQAPGGNQGMVPVGAGQGAGQIPQLQ